MKLADCLRLFALFYEIGRQFQAVCTFWALQPRKLGNVSGYLHCFMKLADSLRLFALFVHSSPENCGASQALCTAMLKMADSLRLFAFVGRSAPENWGKFQAICIVL